MTFGKWFESLKVTLVLRSFLPVDCFSEYLSKVAFILITLLEQEAMSSSIMGSTFSHGLKSWDSAGVFLVFVLCLGVAGCLEGTDC